ncbi:MAG: hypothetical protein IH587_08120 [Anaerolineae bacterium]|nr:hypothetical protein [Anaerolineae bacterium]
MPDIDDRLRRERRIVRALGGASDEALTLIMEALGDDIDISRVTPEIWAEIQRRFSGVLLPELEQLFIDQALRLMDEVRVGIEWDVINTRAQTWARTYTFDLVKGINDNSRTALQQYVSNFFESGVTKGDLEDQIARLYGPVRGDMIATTEVTRASVQGELAYGEELTKLGLNLVPIWQSRNDSAVCPICAPLNQVKQGDGWTIPPPAHVNCRCFLTYEVISPTKSLHLLKDCTLKIITKDAA